MSMEIRALHHSPPWSELPKDLLHFIQTKLRDIFDFVTFRSVCKSWMSAGGRSYPSTGEQLPWLMLHYDPDSVERCFYSFSTGSVHVLRLPEARGRITLSSGNGWLLLLDPSSNKLSFLHPLTRHLIPIPPPPIPPIAFDRIRWYCLDGGAAFQFGDEFVYWKADEGWSRVHLCTQEVIKDVAYHKGQFYATNCANDLLSVCPPRAGAVGRVAWSLPLPATLRLSYDAYLVSYLVSYGEDLLLLIRTGDGSGCISFFRLEESAANAMQWSIISRPCDFSLFLTPTNYAFVNTSGDGSHYIFSSVAFKSRREPGPDVQKFMIRMFEDGGWKRDFEIWETSPNVLQGECVLLTPTLFPPEGTNHL